MLGSSVTTQVESTSTPPSFLECQSRAVCGACTAYDSSSILRTMRVMYDEAGYVFSCWWQSRPLYMQCDTQMMVGVLPAHTPHHEPSTIHLHIYITHTLTHLDQTLTVHWIPDELIIRLLCAMCTRDSRIFSVRIARAASVTRKVRTHRTHTYACTGCVTSTKIAVYAGIHYSHTRGPRFFPTILFSLQRFFTSLWSMKF